MKKAVTGKVITALLFITYFAIVLVSFSSCNSVHKVYSKDKYKVDSVSTWATVEAGSYIKDSASGSSLKWDYDNKVFKEYAVLHDTIRGRDTIIFVPKETYYYKGTITKHDTVVLKIHDTVSKVVFANTEVKKEGKVIAKEKTSRKVPTIAIVVVSLLLLALLALYLYKKYFSARK